MFWKYFSRGISLAKLVLTEVPAALKDGVLTVEEMARIFQEIVRICNWDLNIEVPDEIREVSMAIRDSSIDM